MTEDKQRTTSDAPTSRADTVRRALESCGLTQPLPLAEGVAVTIEADVERGGVRLSLVATDPATGDRCALSQFVPVTSTDPEALRPRLAAWLRSVHAKGFRPADVEVLKRLTAQVKRGAPKMRAAIAQAAARAEAKPDAAL